MKKVFILASLLVGFSSFANESMTLDESQRAGCDVRIRYYSTTPAGRCSFDSVVTGVELVANRLQVQCSKVEVVCPTTRDNDRVTEDIRE